MQLRNILLALTALATLATAASAQLVIPFSAVSDATNSSEALGAAVSGQITFDPNTGAYTIEIKNESDGVIVGIGVNMPGAQLGKSDDDKVNLSKSLGNMTKGTTKDGQSGFGSFASGFGAKNPKPTWGIGSGFTVVLDGVLKNYKPGDINSVDDLIAFIGTQGNSQFDLFLRIQSLPNGAGSEKFGITLVAVPEPEAYALFGLGFLGFLAARRRLKARAAANS